MGKVEFFEVREGGEACDAGEAVGLNGDDAEIEKGVKVLEVCELSLSLQMQLRNWLQEQDALSSR